LAALSLLGSKSGKCAKFCFSAREKEKLGQKKQTSCARFQCVCCAKLSNYQRATRPIMPLQTFAHTRESRSSNNSPSQDDDSGDFSLIGPFASSLCARPRLFFTLGARARYDAQPLVARALGFHLSLPLRAAFLFSCTAAVPCAEIKRASGRANLARMDLWRLRT